MVRSMIAGVAGLKTHQSKLDVIGNNIANVNTWGYKSYSFNFKDSMYTNSINSSAGSIMAGAAGGRNPSQVGYGTTIGSISNEFNTGAPAPSSNPLDCMIDGTGFFLVGNMINGSFTNVADSGLNLSRVGIFRVDSNGYLVDDQRSYVYGYALKPGTGIPEKPSQREEKTVTGATATYDKDNETMTIAGVEVTGVPETLTFPEKVQKWIAAVTTKGGKFEGYTIGMNEYNEAGAAVDLTFKANKSGALTYGTDGGDPAISSENPVDLNDAGFNWGNDADGNPVKPVTVTAGSDRVPGVAAVYADELSTLQIPIDPDTGMPYEIQSYKINEDGTIVGVDTKSRTITLGQLAIVTVENPNGLEKTSGYYYTVGANAGDVGAIKPNGGPAGRIMGNYLEMANVDLANEFSQMITTQRGYQANSKIITVTDQMLEELVNLKR